MLLDTAISVHAYEKSFYQSTEKKLLPMYLQAYIFKCYYSDFLPLLQDFALNMY